MYPVVCVAEAFAEYDSILSLAVVILAAILAYLVWKRRALEAPSRRQATAVLKKGQGKSLPEKAGDEILALREERRHILDNVAESRKKYMKGEMDYATFVHLQRTYDAQLVDLDARLNTLYQLSSRPPRPPAELRDMLAEDSA